MILFYQGTPEEGEAFFRSTWPQARAIADNAKTYYHAFGLERGNLKQMFGPEVLACGVRAAQKGHMVGKPTGDPWQMPGMFLMQGAAVVWQHDFRHAGDQPDLEDILRVVEGLQV